MTQADPRQSPLQSIEPHGADAPSTLLHDLCCHHGIATAYLDVWGERQQVAAESLVDLLAAFGVDASTAASAQHAWDEAQAVARQSPLPPVRAVLAHSARWSLAVRVPGAASALHWRIALEDGAILQGSLGVATAGGADPGAAPGESFQERTVEINAALPPGYHHFTVDGLAGETLIVSAPARCYRPAALQDGQRVWGPSVQLYALRSERNWGMGDFTDLCNFIGLMAQSGASLVGLNPLHALFASRPGHTSPYSPSSKRLLNVLYIDPEAVAGFEQCAAAKARLRSDAFQLRLAGLRAEPLVDHAGVAAAKLEILALLFEEFQRGPRHGAFGAFIQQGGETLRNHAVFEAMQEDAALPSPPAAPDSPEVALFAERHADRVLFHQYLQWLAHVQLQRAVEASRAQGMAVGLYLDLAVSVDGSGSDAWAAADMFASEARVGAPADAFNPNGQDWGLLPLRSDSLHADGYRYFIETLRANMRHAGALRIDHVMGLMRLFWIPGQRNARGGSYVHYAMDEMLAIVALESQRHHCMVIGEDLGTVAPEMQEAMAQRDLLSYRLLYFERGTGSFKPPRDYPPAALVAVSTHDLATFHGWWSGEDLRVRLAQGLYPAPEIFEAQLLDRSRERGELLLALKQAGLISHEAMGRLAFCSLPPAELVEAVHAFLASTPCSLMVVQPEDFLGVVEQANLPGTTTEQPNWRRKLPLDLEALACDAGMAGMARTLSAYRQSHRNTNPPSMKDTP